MINLKSQTLVTTLKINWEEKRKQTRNFIEIKRLRRIRKLQTPQYADCMNCGETLQGMYCHKCGQYALDVKQNVFSYIRNFVENVYQLDGKIVQTLRYLITKPGFLSDEFVKGRINSYVHPMRLYLFMSMLFFSFVLLIFSNINVYDKIKADEETMNTVFNSIKAEHTTDMADKSVENLLQHAEPVQNGVNSFLDSFGKEEDALRNKRMMNVVYREVLARLTKYTPFILLFLIPFYAWILYCGYRRTRSYYMHHLVFSFHQHAFFLLFISLDVLLLYFLDIQNPDLLYGILLFSAALFLVHHLVATHCFYRKSWLETLFRSCLNLSVYAALLFVVAVIAGIFIGVSIYKEVTSGLL